MIVYGSYLKRDVDIISSAKNTVIFDTLGIFSRVSYNTSCFCI